jgi:hypothetical protein
MKELCVLLLKPSQNNDKRENVADEFFSQLAEILKGKKFNLSAELVIYDKFLWFFLTCPENITNIIKGQWHSHYSN